MDRKLATVRMINELNPIEGADKIEVATIDGWKVVVKKGDFKVGDPCIYLEIDSIVPGDVAFWKFLTERKYRIKTIKLRKQISQGIALPINESTCKGLGIDKKLSVGDDVTEMLKIEKYISPSEQEQSEPSGKKKNAFTKFMLRFGWYRRLFSNKYESFPSWLPKTDEERLQNMKWVLSEHKNDVFYVTEKLDGQSATYWYRRKGLFGGEFGICSRNNRRSEKGNSNWARIAKIYDIKKRLKKYGSSIAIQGEIVGPGIQKNRYNLDELKFYIFNIIDVKSKRFFTLREMEMFCLRTGFVKVPMIRRGFLLPSTVDEVVAISNGGSLLHRTNREGIVVRTHDKSVGFKVISPEFLLKNDE